MPRKAANLTADPKLVNPAGGDFHLTVRSSAIDADLTLSEVPNDYAGGARPFGSAYDIGHMNLAPLLIPVVRRLMSF